MRIIWATPALSGLQKIYEYIYESSPQNADRIVEEIIQKVTALKENPEQYNPDRYKRNNTGEYRVFEHKKVRISYKVSADKIEVVRIKHTKQKPQKY